MAVNQSVVPNQAQFFIRNVKFPMVCLTLPANHNPNNASPVITGDCNTASTHSDKSNLTRLTPLTWIANLTNDGQYNLIYNRNNFTLINQGNGSAGTQSQPHNGSFWRIVPSNISYGYSIQQTLDKATWGLTLNQTLNQNNLTVEQYDPKVPSAHQEWVFQDATDMFPGNSNITL